MVAFADTSVLSRTYAAKTRSQVDPNQEMIGLGAANLAAGLFQGFPISSSSSRTPVAEAAGAKTQLTGVVGAVAVALAAQSRTHASVAHGVWATHRRISPLTRIWTEGISQKLKTGKRPSISSHFKCLRERWTQRCLHYLRGCELPFC
jgi:hypothetical protein